MKSFSSNVCTTDLVYSNDELDKLFIFLYGFGLGFNRWRLLAGSVRLSESRDKCSIDLCSRSK